MSPPRPAGSGARTTWRDVSGILLLDKPVGVTSNRALQAVRALFQARKAGHTGSLDPLASGMLPLCFGEATKFSGYLLGADKVYEVRPRWGVATDTADADGQPTGAVGPATVDRELLLSVLPGFLGEQRQVPPMYSALKREGRRLYELARAGQTVEREARSIVIHGLDLVDYDPAGPLLRVHCSKGTYIRSLVEDLAAAAGTVGHVASLRRLAVSPFSPEAMVTLPALEAAAAGGIAALDQHLLPPEAGLVDWPALALDPAHSEALLHGQPVPAPSAAAPGRARLYGPDGRFLGVGEVRPDGWLVSTRLLATGHAENLSDSCN